MKLLGAKSELYDHQIRILSTYKLSCLIQVMKTRIENAVGFSKRQIKIYELFKYMFF